MGDLSPNKHVVYLLIGEDAVTIYDQDGASAVKQAYENDEIGRLETFRFSFFTKNDRDTACDMLTKVAGIDRCSFLSETDYVLLNDDL